MTSQGERGEGKNAEAQRGRRGRKAGKMLQENEISRVVIGAAIEVHRRLGGPGLLESIYEEALAYELQLRGLEVERQKVITITYKGQQLSNNLRLDLVVEKKVIVECKATDKDNPIFENQTLKQKE